MLKEDENRKFINEDLAYLIGVLLGDGTIHGPIKRSCGGFYKIISISGEKEFLLIVKNVVKKIFNHDSVMFKRKDRNNTWRLNISTSHIYDFFTKTIGLPTGKKAGKLPKYDQIGLPNNLFKYFLAGLIDSDGYVTKKRINLIQKDRIFLEDIKRLSKELLEIEFNGPNVNRKIENKIVGWCLQINRKQCINIFFNKMPLKYKIPS